MPYALQSMLKIRIMREDRASTELTSARRAQDAAEAERDKRRNESDEYNKTKEERRTKIYNSVIGHLVTLDSLDEVRSAVTRIDEEALLLEEARDQAQHELEARTAEAEAARIRYVAAARNKMKIEQHKASWEEEDRREQEMRTDREMEEFTGKKFINDDGDTLV